ncbi:MAG: proton-conducting transporter membrane subunit, partial [Sediminibacterium sp.]
MLLSFILIPLITALLLLFIKDNKIATTVSVVTTLGTLVVAILLAFRGAIDFATSWIPVLNAQILLHADGLAKLLVLLTAISFPAIIIATSHNLTKQKNIFLSLILFTQSGLMGVFLAGDALLFYFFWELALIPIYFLCSIWGGEKRITVTFKFFIYTFLGSLLMLVGIILVYLNTPDHSFSLTSFMHANLSAVQQVTAFALFFFAFAIKMPIFPLHTWQPDA